MTFIIITGNVVDGLGFIGPYELYEDALEDIKDSNHEWVVAELTPTGEQKIAKLEVSITCPRCHMESFNPNDVFHKYCGNCQAYHSELITMFIPTQEKKRR